MALTLRVISPNAATLGRSAEYRFTSQGGTIGRAAGTDWQLPDPERVLSSRHAAVHMRSGRWYVEDTSTNGVFLNSADQPVGRGNSAPLSDGDRLVIGEYELAVSIDAEPQPYAPPRRAVPLAGGAAGTSPTNPTALGGDEPVDPLLVLDDPFGPSPPELERQNRPGAMADYVAPQHRPFEPRRTVSDEIPKDYDPLVTGYAHAERPSSPQQRAASPSDLDSPGTGAGAIPRDYNPLMTEFSSDEAPVTREVEEAACSSPPQSRGFLGQPGLVAPSARSRPMPPTGAQEPVREPLAESRPPAPRRSAAPGLATDAPGGAGAPGRTDMLALSALLEGAGVSLSSVSPGGALELMQIAGRVFREAVAGLMDVLAARAALKNEFRLDRTVLRSARNNPLKFSVSVDEALDKMLCRHGDGYMPPVEAVQESFDDLKAHQMAMVAGMQAAFTSVLQELDPKALEEKFDRSTKATSLLAMPRRLRYWEMYRAHYEELAGDPDEALRHLFGEAFARAYEAQMAAYEQARQGPPPRR